MVQGPRGEEVLRGLDGYERMVDTFAQNAKAYWGAWGPLGEPMVRGVEAWAETQRAYLQWLRQTPGARDYSAPSEVSRYQEGDSAAEGRSAGEEAQEIAEKARRDASEAQREAARETESSATEARRSPEEEVRSAIREYVRRSEEAVGREGPRAESASEEIRADAEGLPLEGYDSLNVNRVTQRLGGLSVEEIERLRDYDAENKGLRSLLARFERKIRAARREDLRSSGETEEGPREVVSSTVREARQEERRGGLGGQRLTHLRPSNTGTTESSRARACGGELLLRELHGEPSSKVYERGGSSHSASCRIVGR